MALIIRHAAAQVNPLFVTVHRGINHMCPKDCRAKLEFDELEQLVVAAV
ncbi:MAG: hypothetical protein IKW48_09875 [Akkermansia sp.]|nr:hypothetical protein [Akkermansia sp.]